MQNMHKTTHGTINRCPLADPQRAEMEVSLLGAQAVQGEKWIAVIKSVRGDLTMRTCDTHRGALGHDEWCDVR